MFLSIRLDKVRGTGNVESTNRFRPSHFLDQGLVQVLHQYSRLTSTYQFKH